MTGPHQGQPLATGGVPLDDAAAAMVMIHGRGATAESILGLADEFYHDGVALLAPQAADQSWYPSSFLAPVEQNEPGRSSGLEAVGDAVDRATDAGVPRERVALLGFSQGACLASEFVAREPAHYGGLVALSGGLIGEEIDPDEYKGDLAGTPVFLGCSDHDPHIPESRVHETAEAFERLGGDVTARVYDGMGHEVNDDELRYVAELLARLTNGHGN